MADLNEIYRFICKDIIDRRKGGKIPLMKQDDFFSAVFTEELKLHYPYLLNHQHHTFSRKSFDALAEKKYSSQMQRQSVMLYFLNHPSAINALSGSCRNFMSSRTSIISFDRYQEGVKKWLSHLHLNKDEPLLKHLSHPDKAPDTIQLYSQQMAWMLLDAFSVSPDDLCFLYSKYVQAGKNSMDSDNRLKTVFRLRGLHTHAVKVLEEKDDKTKKARYFDLAQEFGRVKAQYQQTQSSFPEKYQALFREALSNFEQFLSDLEHKSPAPYLNLNLMQKNVKKLEELCSENS